MESTHLLDFALGLSGSSSSTEKSRGLGGGAVTDGPGDNPSASSLCWTVTRSSSLPRGRKDMCLNLRRHPKRSASCWKLSIDSESVH